MLAGILTESDNGKFTFRYDDRYLNSKESQAISITLPLTPQEYHSDHLFPFFYNMLSEGSNKQRYCRLYKIDENDDFGLLLATAHEDTIEHSTLRDFFIEK